MSEGSTLSVADGALTIALNGLKIISDVVIDPADAVEADADIGDLFARFIRGDDVPVADSAFACFLLEGFTIVLL